jgi:hypothetical protein
LSLDYRARIEGARWSGRATLSPEHLPAGPYRANACAIHGGAAGRRYLSATALGGDAPDFHRPDLFPEVVLDDVDPGLAPEDWRAFSGQTEVLSVEEIVTGQSLSRGDRRDSRSGGPRARPERESSDGGWLLPILGAVVAVSLITGVGFVGVSVIKRQVPVVDPRAASEWTAPQRAEASSTRELSKVDGAWASCYASNAIDGRPDTGWCEGSPKDGLGESLRLTLDGRRIDAIRVIPGLGGQGVDGDRAALPGQSSWRANNRVAVLQVQTYDLRGELLEERLAKLVDAPAWQTIPLKGPAAVSRLVLTLVEVYPSARMPGKLGRPRHSGLAEVQVRLLSSP